MNNPNTRSKPASAGQDSNVTSTTRRKTRAAKQDPRTTSNTESDSVLDDRVERRDSASKPGDNTDTLTAPEPSDTHKNPAPLLPSATYAHDHCEPTLPKRTHDALVEANTNATLLPATGHAASPNHIEPSPCVNARTTAVAVESSADAPDAPLSSIRDLKPTLKAWTLAGRVLCRTAPHAFNTVRGRGKVFNFHIIDQAGDTIKAAMFNDGVDRFDDVLCNGAAFSFSGGRVKRSDTMHTGDMYELTFDHHSTIEPLYDDQTPADLVVSTTPLKDLATIPIRNKVSVMGIVTVAEACKKFLNQANEERYRRNILLVDDSMSKVVCTVWGQVARQDFSQFVEKPAMIRFASLNDYNGLRSISALSGSTAMFNPALQVAERLNEWYATRPDQEDFSFVPSPTN